MKTENWSKKNPQKTASNVYCQANNVQGIQIYKLQICFVQIRIKTSTQYKYNPILHRYDYFLNGIRQTGSELKAKAIFSSPLRRRGDIDPKTSSKADTSLGQ